METPSDLFWQEYSRRVERVPPDHGMQWQITPYVVRYVGEGIEPYWYSICMKTECLEPGLQSSIVKQEKESALKAHRNFEWKTYEYPKTPYLISTLEKEGFKCTQRSTMLYLSVDTDVTLKKNDFSVSHVRSQEDFDSVKKILMDVWGYADQSLLRALTNEVKTPTRRTEVLLASDAVGPVACAWMKYYGRIAYLFGGSTVSRARGRGAYRVLIRERMKLASAAGMKYVVSECSSDSERVLRKLNFMDAGQVFRYEFKMIPNQII